MDVVHQKNGEHNLEQIVVAIGDHNRSHNSFWGIAFVPHTVLSARSIVKLDNRLYDIVVIFRTIFDYLF
jgi:hypothetical protein